MLSESSMIQNKEITKLILNDSNLKPLREVMEDCGWPAATVLLTPQQRLQRLLTSGLPKFDMQFDKIIVDLNSKLLGSAEQQEYSTISDGQCYIAASLPYYIMLLAEISKPFGLEYTQASKVKAKLKNFIEPEGRVLQPFINERQCVRFLTYICLRFLLKQNPRPIIISELNRIVRIFFETHTSKLALSICKILSRLIDELNFWNSETVQLQNHLITILKKDKLESRILLIEENAKRKSIEVVKSWMGKSAKLNLILQDWIDGKENYDNLEKNNILIKTILAEEFKKPDQKTFTITKSIFNLLLQIQELEKKFPTVYSNLDADRSNLRIHLPSQAIRYICTAVILKLVEQNILLDEESADLFAQYLLIDEFFRKQVINLPEGKGIAFLTKLLPVVKNSEVKNELLQYLGKAAIVFDPAIFIEQIYPPTRKDFSNKSFIGGEPFLPDKIEWPLSKSGKPLHFLAQIECSSLPVSMKLTDKIFPIKNSLTVGFLYFFALCDNSQELCFGDDFPTKVIYWPHNIDNVQARKVPEQITEICFTSNRHFSYHEIEDRYKFYTYPRVPLHFSAYMSSSEESPFYNKDLPFLVAPNNYFLDKVLFNELMTKTRIEKLKQISPINLSNCGYPYISWPWLTKQPNNSNGEAVDIPETYPWKWLVIERTALAIHYELNTQFGRSKFKDALLDAWPNVIKESKNWVKEALVFDKLDDVDTNKTQEFQNWISALWNEKESDSLTCKDKISTRHTAVTSSLKNALKSGLYAAWSYIASSGNLQGIDNSFIEELSSGHQPGNWGPQQIHQMFGIARTIQGYNTNVPEEHILLLQLSSDCGADMMFGDVGMIQFWIKPEDLERLNFENTVAVVGN